MCSKSLTKSYHHSLFEGVLVYSGCKTYHIQGGDTKDLVGVVRPELLQRFNGNGNCGVHWIGDDVQQSLHHQDNVYKATRTSF